MTHHRVSIAVATRVLQRYTAINPGPIVPYHIIPFRGAYAPAACVFVDMDLVWIDILFRHGKRVIGNPAFRLQQLLAAEAWMHARWPTRRRATIPARLIDRIEVDRSSSSSSPYRRPRRPRDPDARP